jgi:hypothetical protein
MNTIHFTYACCIFFSFFSQNSSDNYESGVRSTKGKKKRVQVSTSANDKHEERMQKVGGKEKELGKEE